MHQNRAKNRTGTETGMMTKLTEPNPGLVLVPRHSPLRAGLSVLGHVLKKVPRQVLEHMPNYVPDKRVPKHMLAKHVPEHVLAKHLFKHVLGLFFYRENNLTITCLVFVLYAIFSFFGTVCANW